MVCMGEGVLVSLSSDDSALCITIIPMYAFRPCAGKWLVASSIVRSQSLDVVNGVQMELATQLIGGYEPPSFCRLALILLGGLCIITNAAIV